MVLSITRLLMKVHKIAFSSSQVYHSLFYLIVNNDEILDLGCWISDFGKQISGVGFRNKFALFNLKSLTLQSLIYSINKSPQISRVFVKSIYIFAFIDEIKN